MKGERSGPFSEKEAGQISPHFLRLSGSNRVEGSFLRALPTEAASLMWNFSSHRSGGTQGSSNSPSLQDLVKGLTLTP